MYHFLMQRYVFPWKSGLGIPLHGFCNPFHSGRRNSVHLLLCHLVGSEVLVRPWNIGAFPEAWALKQSPKPLGNVWELFYGPQSSIP